MGVVGKVAGGFGKMLGLTPDMPKPPKLPELPKESGLQGAQRKIDEASDPESVISAANRRRKTALAGRGIKDTILTSPLGVTEAATTNRKTLLGE